MVHGEAKETFKECAFDGLPMNAMFEVEFELDELLENER
jgi:hypothetical protein